MKSLCMYQIVDINQYVPFICFNLYFQIKELKVRQTLLSNWRQGHFYLYNGLFEFTRDYKTIVIQYSLMTLLNIHLLESHHTIMHFLWPLKLH